VAERRGEASVDMTLASRKRHADDVISAPCILSKGQTYVDLCRILRLLAGCRSGNLLLAKASAFLPRDGILRKAQTSAVMPFD
jgi:hypothetical protein